jgi:predicted NBD/HSP70 family sugar kinase
MLVDVQACYFACMSGGGSLPDRQPVPGRPRLLRTLNEQAALRALLAEGPLTRARIAQLTGLSKVTASTLIERLEARGLVKSVGTADGSRGPNAANYSLVPEAAYVVGVDVNPDRVVAATVDITGRVEGRIALDNDTSADPVAVTCAAVRAAVEAAGAPPDKVRRIVVGAPGLVEPATRELRFSWDLPRWQEGLLVALRAQLDRPVAFENDANAAAIAEARLGAAKGVADYLLVWLGRGIGLALVLGGVLYRGATGAAGELGFLPVPGAPAETTPTSTGALGGAFQHLVGAENVLAIARDAGVFADSAEAAVRMAVAMGPAGVPILDELARRVALGVGGLSAVLDPALVILAGEVGRAGGEVLARRVELAVARIAPAAPRIATTGVPTDPVLHGVLLSGLDAVRDDVLGLDDFSVLAHAR